MIDSLLGATWAAKQAGDDWTHLPPWVIGDTLGNDEAAARSAEREVGVFVYTHADRKPLYDVNLVAGWDYDLENLLEAPVGKVIRVVAGALPFGGPATGHSTRLAAAARHALLAARLLDPTQRRLHFTVGLEALVALRSEGNVVSSFKQRVVRLLELPPSGADFHERRLGDIYEERSRAVHAGFTKSTFEALSIRAREAQTYLIRAAIKVSELVEGGISSEAEFLAWLDSES